MQLRVHLAVLRNTDGSGSAAWEDVEMPEIGEKAAATPHGAVRSRVPSRVPSVKWSATAFLQAECSLRKCAGQGPHPGAPSRACGSEALPRAAPSGVSCPRSQSFLVEAPATLIFVLHTHLPPRHCFRFSVSVLSSIPRPLRGEEELTHSPRGVLAEGNRG